MVKILKKKAKRISFLSILFGIWFYLFNKNKLKLLYSFSLGFLCATDKAMVLVNYKKETIDPPKKCAIARWFQKKHKIVEVNIVEKSPYIENKQQKFIEIIK